MKAKIKGNSMPARIVNDYLEDSNRTMCVSGKIIRPNYTRQNKVIQYKDDVCRLLDSLKIKHITVTHSEPEKIYIQVL